MPLRSGGPDATAVARLSLSNRPDGSCTGFVVWQGDESLIPHLPGVYLDKLLSNLRRRPDGPLLLAKFESILEEARAVLPEPGAPVWYGLVEIEEEPPGREDAAVKVTIMMNFARQNAGAMTTFKPIRGANPQIGELALSAFWDWTCHTLQSVEDVAAVVDNLLEQCLFYRVNGLPKLRHIGRAPFHAMMSGNARRLREEIGARAGIGGEELMELPEDERAELIREHSEHQAAAIQAANDPAFQAYTDHLIDRVNELWRSRRNPLTRDEAPAGGPAGPGAREQAIMKYAADAAARDYAFDAVERDEEVDRDGYARELLPLANLMAAAYLWREAEREGAANADEELEEIRFAVEWIHEHEPEEEKTLSKRLARAAWWAVNGGSSLPFVPAGRDLHGEIVVDVGFETLLEFAYDGEAIDLRESKLQPTTLRQIFNAGIALRELERYFSR